MKKKFVNPLIVLAAGLIIVGASSVGATRAAMTYSNEAEQVDFSTSNLAVDIQEKQDDKYQSVAEGALTFPAIASDMNLGSFKIGKTYPEEVQVVNTSSGNYAEYVRVMVRRSWTDEKGTKDSVLDPSLIKLGTSEGWLEDKADATTEGQAFYLAKPLKKGESAQFLETITIDNQVVTYVKTVDGDVAGTVVNEYKYDGKRFFVELRVDAVQTHNASEAILGAWGVKASLDSNGNIISIN